MAPGLPAGLGVLCAGLQATWPHRHPLAHSACSPRGPAGKCPTETMPPAPGQGARTGSEAKAPSPPTAPWLSAPSCLGLCSAPARLRRPERPLGDPGATGLVGRAGIPHAPGPGADGRPPAGLGAGHVQHGEQPRANRWPGRPELIFQVKGHGAAQLGAEAINPRRREPAPTARLPATRRVTVSGPSEWSDCSHTTGRRAPHGTERASREAKERFKSLGRKSIGGGARAFLHAGPSPAPLSPRPAPGKRKLPACEGGGIDTAVSEQTLFHIWLASPPAGARPVLTSRRGRQQAAFGADTGRHASSGPRPRMSGSGLKSPSTPLTKGKSPRVAADTAGLGPPAGTAPWTWPPDPSARVHAPPSTDGHSARRQPGLLLGAPLGQRPPACGTAPTQRNTHT